MHGSGRQVIRVGLSDQRVKDEGRIGLFFYRGRVSAGCGARLRDARLFCGASAWRLKRPAPPAGGERKACNKQNDKNSHFLIPVRLIGALTVSRKKHRAL